MDKYPRYSPDHRDVPQLESFRPMSLNEILSIIMEMQTKHCDLDPIPVLVLKELVPHVLPEISLLVNLSLTEGEFSEAWKTAIIKPLIKKIGLELKSSSYHPVSNLTFISKTGGMLYA